MHLRRIATLGALTLSVLGGCSADHQTGDSAVASGSAAAEVRETAPGAGAAAAVQESSVSPVATDAQSRAFIDPVTGELRTPTAEELAALPKPEPTESTEGKPTVPPAETRLPDGTIRYDMSNQPQVDEKVCVQADGSIGPCPAK